MVCAPPGCVSVGTVHVKILVNVTPSVRVVSGVLWTSVRFLGAAGRSGQSAVCLQVSQQLTDYTSLGRGQGGRGGGGGYL